jgi:hypothetical protein
MNDSPFRRHRDPFATLVSLTAAALTGPVTSVTDDRPAPGKPGSRNGSLLDRLDRWLWKQRQRDLERALTSAVDVEEIEARLRERERRLLQRYY